MIIMIIIMMMRMMMMMMMMMIIIMMMIISLILIVFLFRATLDKYQVKVSARLGRSKSKEQYAYLFR